MLGSDFTNNCLHSEMLAECPSFGVTPELAVTNVARGGNCWYICSISGPIYLLNFRPKERPSALHNRNLEHQGWASNVLSLDLATMGKATHYHIRRKVAQMYLINLQTSWKWKSNYQVNHLHGWHLPITHWSAYIHKNESHLFVKIDPGLCD